jgi:hypothetical protein
MPATTSTASEPTSAGRPEPDPLPTTAADDRSAPWLLWVIPLILVAPLPALFRQYLNPIHAFRLHLFVVMALLSFVFGFLVAAAVSGGFRRRRRAALAVGTIAVLVLLMWPLYTIVGAIVADRFGIGLLSDVIPVLVAAGLVWAAARHGSTRAGLFALTAVLLLFIGALWFQLSDRVVGAPAAVEIAAPAPNAPDVLVVVLDGYPRADVLADDFGYDNGALLDALGRRGFVTSEAAVTGYSVTWASLAAMLDLGYPIGEGLVSEADHAELRRLRSGDAAMVRTFKAAGYEAIFFENAWDGSHCGRAYDRCLRPGIIYRSLYRLGELTPLAGPLRNLFVDPFAALGPPQLSELGALVAEPSERPRLIISHATIPHPPLNLDAECTLVRGTGRSGLHLARSATDDTSRVVDAYAGQLRCVNTLVLGAVDALLAADPDAMVMITSDHGSDLRAQMFTDPTEWTDAAVRERVGILSAHRLPGCDAEVPSDVSLINGARIITSCALDVDLPLLETRFYVAPDEGDIEGAVVDLTHRLDGAD